MAKKLTRQVEIEFARVLFDALADAAENQDDEVYELMDPEYEYDGDELCKRLNNDTIKEVIALGFKAKYGEDWHQEAKPKTQAEWCAGCETECPRSRKCQQATANRKLLFGAIASFAMTGAGELP